MAIKINDKALIIQLVGPWLDLRSFAYCLRTAKVFLSALYNPKASEPFAKAVFIRLRIYNSICPAPTVFQAAARFLPPNADKSQTIEERFCAKFQGPPQPGLRRKSELNLKVGLGKQDMNMCEEAVQQLHILHNFGTRSSPQALFKYLLRIDNPEVYPAIIGLLQFHLKSMLMAVNKQEKLTDIFQIDSTVFRFRKLCKKIAAAEPTSAPSTLARLYLEKLHVAVAKRASEEFEAQTRDVFAFTALVDLCPHIALFYSNRKEDDELLHQLFRRIMETAPQFARGAYAYSLVAKACLNRAKSPEQCADSPFPHLFSDAKGRLLKELPRMLRHVHRKNRAVENNDLLMTAALASTTALGLHDQELQERAKETLSRCLEKTALARCPQKKLTLLHHFFASVGGNSKKLIKREATAPFVRDFMGRAIQELFKELTLFLDALARPKEEENQKKLIDFLLPTLIVIAIYAQTHEQRAEAFHMVSHLLKHSNKLKSAEAKKSSLNAFITLLRLCSEVDFSPETVFMLSTFLLKAISKLKREEDKHALLSSFLPSIPMNAFTPSLMQLILEVTSELSIQNQLLIFTVCLYSALELPTQAYLATLRECLTRITKFAEQVEHHSAIVMLLQAKLETNPPEGRSLLLETWKAIREKIKDPQLLSILKEHSL